MTDRPVALAAVIGAHGLDGAVRLKLFTESLAGLRAHRAFNDGALTLVSVRADGAGAVARFAEATSRDQAEALRGVLLTVARASLPPLAAGEYYHADLIGMAVVSTAGEAVGQVAAVENYGAGDILDIERADGSRIMVPFNAAAVPEVAEAVVVAAEFLE